jgi:succinate dehydrogenase flavin-adding protein (antitoxin of CptAB toxin-antitoxin module)
MNFFNKKRFQNVIFKKFCEATSFKIKLNDDLNVAKRQVLWRIRNLGQLELEVLIGRWAEDNVNLMSISDLKLFTEEILEKEVVDLDGYFLKGKELPMETKYPFIIKKYLSNSTGKL